MLLRGKKLAIYAFRNWSNPAHPIPARVMDRSLQNTHVKLLARDLLHLKPTRSNSTSFSLDGASISRAEIVGTVVSRDLTPKFLKFGVDDGTGCVTCVLWLNHLTSSYFSRWDPSTLRLVADAARTQSSFLTIGASVRVRGRIVSYRGAVQITTTVVVFERDPNAEILHWLECLTLSRNCYRLQQTCKPNSRYSLGSISLQKK